MRTRNFPLFRLIPLTLAFSLSAALSGCFVDGRCTSAAECSDGKVCREGKCEYACTQDLDCAKSELCIEHHCQTASDCLGCAARYPWAEGVCKAGMCAMGECEPGHINLNGLSEDGCEYACSSGAAAYEICNGKDDDCDGEIDEGFDLSKDLANCGACGAVCARPNAVTTCDAGRCLLVECNEGAYDLNDDPQDGCEYVCTPTGPETCNHVDDDCDGEIDEGFDFVRDIFHCGGCNQVCATPAHAKPICLSGGCAFYCDVGYYDNNHNIEDGCESTTCQLSHGGVEACDLIDNDCDGETDEGFDKTLPESCGPLCTICETPAHATAGCNDGRCGIGACEQNFYDLDGKSENGCEYECVATGEEICDGLDNDCDGLIDEGIDKDVPESCGPTCKVCEFAHATALCVELECAMGACDAGFYDINHSAEDGCEYACELTNGGVELCDDGLDNDCDGEIDEGCGLTCPEDMSNVADLFCIDRYEASHSDATSTTQGVSTEAAKSVAGVLPWRLSGGDVQTARTACAAAGKRLCTAAEWTLACRGPENTEYSYGNTYSPATCNGIDTFCPDEPYPHCYQDNRSTTRFRLMPTGSFENCVNGYGIYDINGNLWEYIDSATPTARGGAFNCSDSEAFHKCGALPEGGTGSHIGNWNPSAIGFRCCSDGK